MVNNITTQTNPEIETFSIGDRVHIGRYTDVDPGTVVDIRRNGKEIHVRNDQFKLADGQKPDFTPGGFAGHCNNQHQLVYDISENPSGAVEVFTIRTWRGRKVWTAKGSTPDGRNRVRKGWKAFYDYNF